MISQRPHLEVPAIPLPSALDRSRLDLHLHVAVTCGGERLGFSLGDAGDPDIQRYRQAEPAVRGQADPDRFYYVWNRMGDFAPPAVSLPALLTLQQAVSGPEVLFVRDRAADPCGADQYGGDARDALLQGAFVLLEDCAAALPCPEGLLQRESIQRQLFRETPQHRWIADVPGIPEERLVQRQIEGGKAVGAPLLDPLRRFQRRERRAWVSGADLWDIEWEPRQFPSGAPVPQVVLRERSLLLLGQEDKGPMNELHRRPQIPF